jgi:hypothetical protein
VRDGLAEHVEDGAVEARDAAARERVGGGERVEAREEENLRGVDVAEAGDFRLVEQNVLQRAPRASENVGEPVGRELVRERLGREVAQLARLARGA